MTGAFAAGMSAARTGSAPPLSTGSAATAARSFVLIVIAVSPTFDTAKVPNSPRRGKMKFCASAQFLVIFDPKQPVRGNRCRKATFLTASVSRIFQKSGAILYDLFTNPAFAGEVRAMKRRQPRFGIGREHA
ncbi:hypothetical protein [Methylorubrum thiocyanatum]